ncbi:hypothetical protein DENIS_1779 [Desulfonema ishimotonii]|uniref:Sulfate transporter CysZ n=1 Tax=Desulfonema ishimotonii TaxID=45657 RepID=A0A401FV34_9BACT|nr:EI24 domain-containing protein [Desulfonema ishimotonii]GBC60820.1 hypothetical protein DENIS_1779 [Desulfonema ishimotonii]
MFLKEFFRGIGAYAKANRAIFKYRLWPYMIVPGLMSFCYILTLVIIGRTWFGVLADYVNTQWVPGFMQGAVVEMLTTFLLWVLLMLTGYVTYQPVILVLFSPVLSYLSEITEVRVYNQPGPPFHIKNILKDIIRSILINSRNILKMLLLILMAWILIIIPVVGAILSTVLIVLIQSYYNGFSLADYTLERKRYSVRESIRFVSQNRARFIGTGMGFMLMLLVPVLGWVAAPAYGTVAATLSALEIINDGASQIENM